MKKIKFRFTEKWAPWLLLAFTAAAYLPLVSQLGFYWDDWPMLWYKVVPGSQGFGFGSAFSSDRPFLGFLYQATALLNNDPLVWQILTVFFRGMVTLAFWWTLKQLWPERKHEVFWISLLLAVYPGFKQMPIAYVWMNAFIMECAYVLSWGMMLKAIRSGSKKGWLLWTIPSVFLFTFCTISTEYYTGLEICRGVVLWIFLMREASFREASLIQKVWKVLREWLPYLAVLGIFMFWRVFIFQFPSYQPVLLDELAANPFRAVLSVAARMVEDAYTAVWGAWTEFFRFPNHIDFTTASGKLFWVAVVGVLALALMTVNLWKPADAASRAGKESRSWCRTAMLLGLLMVVLPGLPYWVTSLPIRTSYPYDRFLVAFMFGSSIFLVGMLELLLRTPLQRNILFSLFIAMAVGGNLLNANSYRKDWKMQKSFMDQLVTRIPELEQPTMLLSDDNPLTYESDNSITGMVNLALDPEHQENTLPYSVMLFTPRFGTIENYETNDTIYQEFRSVMFQAEADEVIVYHYSPPGCLRVLDPEQHDLLLSTFPDSYRNFIHLSDPKTRIHPEGTAATFVHDEIFKAPVEQNWCYYFEKADLARQTEDWESIAEIGDQVLSTMKAGDASEYLIFVEAYINLDRWEDAEKTFQRIHAEDHGLDAITCSYLHRWISNHKPEDESIINDLIPAMNSIGCSMSKDGSASGAEE